MKTLDLMQPVRNAIGNAADVDEVSDAFCFVVGFVSSELKGRIETHAKIVESADVTERSKDALQGDLGAIASYTLQLAAIEAGWEAYKSKLGGDHE